MLDIQEIEAEKTMNWKHKTNNAMSKRKGTKKPDSGGQSNIQKTDD
jgi:hypothetical protein